MRLLAEYLFNECNLKISKANSCIFFNKYDKEELELVISFHVDNVFKAGNTETLKHTPKKILRKSSALNSILS